jgi:hypothetical protein
MVDPNDWRLHGQEGYLKGVTLSLRTYRGSEANPRWDHDHCEVCWAKFMVEDQPNALREGYCTADEYRWVCAVCFDDFKEHFGWKLAEGP